MERPVRAGRDRALGGVKIIRQKKCHVGGKIRDLGLPLPDAASPRYVESDPTRNTEPRYRHARAVPYSRDRSLEDPPIGASLRDSKGAATSPAE